MGERILAMHLQRRRIGFERRPDIYIFSFRFADPNAHRRKRINLNREPTSRIANGLVAEIRGA